MTVNKTFRAVAVFSILNLTFVSLAHAGKSVGNGGDAVVCQVAGQGAGQSQTVELLDIFEARQQTKGWAFGLGSADLEFDQKLRIVMDRLSKFSPIRAANYRRTLESKTLLQFIYSSEDLPALHDEGALHAKLPRECRLRQLAVQVPQPLASVGKTLLINRPLEEALSDDEGVALLLHELLTSEAAQSGVRNSSSLRPFNALLLYRDFEKIDSQTFIEQLEASGLPTFESYGLQFVFRLQNGNASRPRFVARRLTEATINEGSLLESVASTLGVAMATGRVGFYPNGALNFFTLYSPARLFYAEKYHELPAGTHLVLDQNGNVLSVSQKHHSETHKQAP